MIGSRATLYEQKTQGNAPYEIYVIIKGYLLQLFFYCAGGIMQFFKRAKQTKAKINRIYEHYRNMVLNDKAAELITKKDYRNLIAIAKHGKPLGRSTAVLAAFVLGYRSGKGGAI